MTSKEKTIIHLHWIEFLYSWGNKYFALFLAPSILAFFRIYTKVVKAKLAITVHNIVPHKVNWSNLERVYFQQMFNLSECLFVHSRLQKKRLCAKFYVNSQKVAVIKHGFFQKPRSVSIETKTFCRQKMGIPSDAIVFAFIGAIAEYKGVSVLLEAIKHFLKDHPDSKIKLIIAGQADRAYMHFLNQHHRGILGNAHVVLMNKQLSEDELANVLSAADLGICPYTNATTPATLLDFASYGLPIITTDDPNVLDTMAGYPLFIAERGDVASLSNNIETAYNMATRSINGFGKIDVSSFVDAWKISADVTLCSFRRLVENKN